MLTLTTLLALLASASCAVLPKEGGGGGTGFADYAYYNWMDNVNTHTYQFNYTCWYRQEMNFDVFAANYWHHYELDGKDWNITSKELLDVCEEASESLKPGSFTWEYFPESLSFRSTFSIRPFGPQQTTKWAFKKAIEHLLAQKLRLNQHDFECKFRHDPDPVTQDWLPHEKCIRLREANIPCKDYYPEYI